jgi:antitoxin HigA-1
MAMPKKLLPPIHPGEILREEFMIPMDLSANALAQRLGVTTARVNEIANERRGITADTALRLARCFSTTPEFWMNLQQRYELEAARRAIGRMVERKVVALDLAG